MALLLPPGERMVDRNGEPVDAGFLYVYQNNTTNLADIYSDPLLSVALDNPVALDGGGLIPTNIYIGPDLYTVRVEHSDNAEVWTRNDCFGWSDDVVIPQSGTLAEATAANLDDGATFLIEGRGWFTYDSGSTATADGVTIIEPGSGVGRLIADVASPEADFRLRNIDSTGASDVAASLGAYIQTKAALGGVVKVTPGRYRVDSTITVTSALPFTLDLTGVEIDFSNASVGDTLFEFHGSHAASVSLTSDAGIANASVAVDSASGDAFVANARALVQSDEIWQASAAGDASDCPIGEIVRVQSESTGTITLESPLMDGYTTADNASIALVTMLQSIRVVGGRLFSSNSGSNDHIAIHALYCEGLSVQGMTIEAFGNRGVWLQSCISSRVVDNYIVDAKASLGYGVAVGDASAHVTVSSNAFTLCRHAFTTTSNTGYNGVTRHITVNNNVINGTEDNGTGSGDALDTHTGAEFINFIGNEVFDAEGDGINFECTSGKIIGNTIYYATGRGINGQNKSKHPGTLIVSDNIVKGSDGVGINIQLAPIAGAVLYESLNLCSNTVQDPNPDTDGILINGGTSDFYNMVIMGNVVIDTSGTGNPLRLVKCNDSVVSGNSLGGTTGPGLRLADCNRVSINGNFVRADASSIGIQLGGTGQENAVVGNVVGSGADYGVWFDDTITHSIASHNVLRSMVTNDVRLGSGAGNQELNNIQ